jgi:pimeloyl-ACP methyl ester carboxylesterase
MVPTWIDRNIYPFTPKQFPVPAGAMSYVDDGTDAGPSAGGPIVMIHGNPSWSFEYRALIRHFSVSHRCIAPDHIGFGLSDKPTDWGYLPAQHAKNLELLLESLDLQEITLVVNDWGGPIGLSYAINHSDRIKNIVITNTWMWSVRSDWYYQVFSRFMGGFIGRWLIRRFNFFAQNIMKTAYGDKSKLSPQIHRHYLMALSEPAERKGCWFFPGQIIGSSAWLADLWAQRDALNGKVKLIAWGMKDIAFREKELNRWTGQFPGARVVRFVDTGHFVADENSEALIAEMTKLLCG